VTERKRSAGARAEQPPAADCRQRPLRARFRQRLRRSVRRSTHQSSTEKKGYPVGKQDLIGTWHLVSSEFRHADGEVTYPIGKNGPAGAFEQKVTVLNFPPV